MERAIVNLEGLGSIVGKIHYYFDLFGDQPVAGSGFYAAQTTESGQLFRWELQIPFRSNSLHWGELFDGQTLWRYQTSAKEQKTQLSRVDVLQVAQYLQQRGNLPKIGEIGNWPGLGGLPRLLRSLQANFQFALLDQSSLRVTDGQHSQLLSVWKLSGQWKPDCLARLLADQAERIHQGLPVQWENVPPQIPDEVIICLGQEDLFPYEIQYQRKGTGGWTGWLNQFAWLRSKDRCLAKLEFVELSLNEPLPADTFHYQPPAHLTPTDTTTEFIQQLEKKMKR